MQHSQFCPQDIEILVTTYNRAAYLKAALTSIVNQTIKGIPITVLDNASTDNTQAIVESFGHHKVIYSRARENGGGIANAKRGQALAHARYVMLLHDDDILHPQFLERVLQCLNYFSDVALIASRFTRFWSRPDELSVYPEFYKPSKNLRQRYFFFQNDPSSFAAGLLWPKSQSCVSGMVVRNDLFKTVDLDALSYDYGKNMDWPYMIGLSSMGNAIVVEDPSSLFYRIHEGQDSLCDNTGVTADQFLRWGKLFYRKLIESANTSRYRGLFDRKIVDLLSYNYRMFLASSHRNAHPLHEYLEQLHHEGFLTREALVYSQRKQNLINRIRSLRIRFSNRINLSTMLVDLSR